MKFSIAAAGDCILARTCKDIQTPAFRELVDIFQKADITFGNIEFTSPRNPRYASPKLDGIRADIFMGIDEFVFDELKWAGFNMFTNANNHSGDFGHQGMMDTKAALEERDLICAGVGVDIADAQAPRYKTINQGRIALIAVTSSYSRGSFASRTRGDAPGRPGLNPLQINTDYVLDAECYEMITQLDEKMGFKAAREAAIKRGSQKDDGILRFMGTRFVKGEANGLRETLSPGEIERIKQEIDNARQNADFVIVTAHHHEGRSGDRHSVLPPEFLEEAAHAWIDAGADLFLGHGPHRIRPMEIYKGKPVIYSPGNFFFTLQCIEKFPAESYDLLGLDDQASVEIVQNFWANALNGAENWEAVLPVLDFEDGRVSEIVLYPVDLQHDEGPRLQGIPILADAEFGRRVLKEYQEMCKLYGTEIIIEDKGDRIIGKVVLS